MIYLAVQDARVPSGKGGQGGKLTIGGPRCETRGLIKHMAKHRKPSKTKKNIQRAGTVTMSSAMALAIATGTAPLAVASPNGGSTIETPVVPQAPVVPAPAPVEPESIIVQPGDYLSRIAPTVGTTWQELYQVNVATIGPDPNLIFPGQVLHFVDGLPLENPPVSTAGDSAPAPQVFSQATISNSAGPVSPRTQAAADAVWSNVSGVQLIAIGGTRASARDPHGHPSGNALDYMVNSDTSLGDTIAQYHIDNWNALGVEYIIWQQKILLSPGGGWQWMEDRGSVTQNHYDHVHVNYN